MGNHMKKRSIESQLQELAAKEKSLRNKIASLAARKRTLDDKVLTRKKILIGAYILEKYKNAQHEMQKLTKELDKFLIKNHDRKLFDLPLISVNKDQAQN